jgi:2-keto-4-pentenoate hydratase/2-oxohepta-3-ene-1,7-dioic acid hydratase in catechol pathway
MTRWEFLISNLIEVGVPDGVFKTGYYENGVPVKGKNGKYIQERHASNYYNGITVGIDFTARDLQNEAKKKGLPWEKSKAFDNSAAVGKFIDITPDINKKNINFSLFKNKELVQNGNSGKMIFSFDAIIANISIQSKYGFIA